jgi:hypothetical protein
MLAAPCRGHPLARRGVAWRGSFVLLFLVFNASLSLALAAESAHFRSPLRTACAASPALWPVAHACLHQPACIPGRCAQRRAGADAARRVGDLRARARSLRRRERAQPPHAVAPLCCRAACCGYLRRTPCCAHSLSKDSTGVSAVDLVQRSPPHWQAIGLALACGFVASCYCVLLNL